jgi:hypothetical protein
MTTATTSLGAGFRRTDDHGKTSGGRTGESAYHEPHRYRPGTQAAGRTHPGFQRRPPGPDSGYSEWSTSAAEGSAAQNRVPGSHLDKLTMQELTTLVEAADVLEEVLRDWSSDE